MDSQQRGGILITLTHKMALIKDLICIKGKFAGSKVKVKSGFINRTCISYKSRTGSRILTKFAMNVLINKVAMLLKCQGHRVKSQGETRLHPLDLI